MPPGGHLNDEFANHKTSTLFRVWPRHLSPHGMVPGGRKPMARPPQDPLLAFLASHAEEYEERLLPGPSKSADCPLANPGQPAPASIALPANADRERSVSERRQSQSRLGGPSARRIGGSS